MTLCLVAAFGLWPAGSVNAGAGPPVQSAGPNLNLTKAPGNQYETAAAINPNNNNQVFVVSRNEVGGLYAARSSDGGINWISQLIATKPVPLPGELPRAYGNPSVAWDPFGNLFLAYLSQGSTGAGTYVCLSLSQDGGGTFYSPTGTGAVLVLPINPPGTPVFGDQPTVTVGPGSSGYPSSVWLTYWTMGGIVVSGAGVSGLGVVASFTSLQPQQPASVNFGDIAVGPKGEVMITYGPNSGSSGKVYINVKPDGLGPGPFSAFIAAVPVNIGGFTPIPAQPNWGIDPEAGLAWDRSTGPNRGRVYLVYTDAPTVGSTDTNIFVVRSDDMGTSWSVPVRVNDDTGVNSQFLPHLSLDQSNGMLAVSWYDARDSALNNTARYYGAFSSDGGATFGPNFPISTGTSNQANSQAALKKTDYGDYTGNAFVNGRLVPAWADNSNSTGDNPDGATGFDVYAAIVQAPDMAGQRPRIFDGGVIKAGAFGAQSGVAAGTWIEIYGSNLASGTADWALADFNGNNAPTRLDHVEVTVNGKAAAISYAGPGQVNAQVPDGIGLGPVPVVVIDNGLASDPVTVPASDILPGLLAPSLFSTGGRQYVVALAGDGSSFVGVPNGFLGGRPARPGEVITLYGIGFGPVTPPVPSGTFTTTLNQLQNQLSVSFDQSAVDLSAPYTYTGLALGCVGLYQFNLTVPNVLEGDHQLKVTVGGVALPQNLAIATGR